MRQRLHSKKRALSQSDSTPVHSQFPRLQEINQLPTQPFSVQAQSGSNTPKTQQVEDASRNHNLLANIAINRPDTQKEESNQETLEERIQGFSWEKADDTIWTKDPGTQYEEIAFQGKEPPHAQIGGSSPSNFPTIDDFRDGVATSLKTIDIVKNYHSSGDEDKAGLKRLRLALEGYKKDLMGFVGRNWGGREIRAAEIRTLRLQIAYPPGATKAHIAVLREFAAQSVVINNLSINKERERQKDIRPSKRRGVENPDPSKMRSIPVPRYEPEFINAPPTTFEIKIEEKSGIWQTTSGYNYEANAFPTETRKSANIGGTFPTIDDFRNGIATSLKTINIVEKYENKKEKIREVLNDYWGELADFNGQIWHVGDNYQVDESLLIDGGNGKKLIQVKGEDIKKLRLQVAIPPIGKIIEQKKSKVKELKNAKPSNQNDKNFDLKINGLEFEVQRIEEKKQIVDQFAEEVKNKKSAKDKPMEFVVEERD